MIEVSVLKYSICSARLSVRTTLVHVKWSGKIKKTCNQSKLHHLVHDLQIWRSQRPPGGYTEPPAITWAKISKQHETPCWLFSLPVMKIASASSSSTAVNTSLGPPSQRRESFIFRGVQFVCLKLQLSFGRSVSKPPQKIHTLL